MACARLLVWIGVRVSAESFILWLKQQKEETARETGRQFLCSCNLKVGFVSRKTILSFPSVAFSIVLVEKSYGEKMNGNWKTECAAPYKTVTYIILKQICH